MPPSEWFMYVVECSDGSLYTGVTPDVQRRLHEHNSTARGAKYTRPRRPVTLIYASPPADRSTVMRQEADFKTLSREQKIITLRESNK